MMTIAICRVKGIRSQKPRPHASTTCPGVDGVAVMPATMTTSVATSAKTNASGTHRSVQSVSARAKRATPPAASGSVARAGGSPVCMLVLRTRGLPGGVAARAVLMQRELLDAPVVHVGDVERVVGRTGQRVNPVELLRVPSGNSHRADDPA